MSDQPTVVVLQPWGFGENGEREILERAGCRVVVSEAKGEEAQIEAIRDCDALIYTGPMTLKMMQSLTCCKVIARSAIGMDNVEGIEGATERGIVLVNVPDVFIEEVANHTMTLLLAVVRDLIPFHEYARSGGWTRRETRPAPYVHRLTGETLGLVGFGNIARSVAKRAIAFGMDILAYDPYLPKEVFAQAGARQGSLAQVLQDSDIVSVHVPLLPQTHHLIGAAQFNLMKKNAILINTARGPVVDEAALIAALQHGDLLGAGLDVTEIEPIPEDNPLRTLPNVVLTPHVASVSAWANGERRRRLALEVGAVLNGMRPRAVYNPAVLEKVRLL